MDKGPTIQRIKLEEICNDFSDEIKKILNEYFSKYLTFNGLYSGEGEKYTEAFEKICFIFNENGIDIVKVCQYLNDYYNCELKDEVINLYKINNSFDFLQTNYPDTYNFISSELSTCNNQLSVEKYADIQLKNYIK